MVFLFLDQVKCHILGMHPQGSEQPSAVITAMGVEAKDALGSVRLSLGRPTSEQEVERAAGVLYEAWVHRPSSDRRF